MSSKNAKELENGNISPRFSAPKRALATALEPVVNGQARQGWLSWSACPFFLHQPKYPKALQDLEEQN